jgi:hypothetical protein
MCVLLMTFRKYDRHIGRRAPLAGALGAIITARRPALSDQPDHAADGETA